MVSKGAILSFRRSRLPVGRSGPARGLLHVAAVAGLFAAGVGAVLGQANDTRADGAPEHVAGQADLDHPSAAAPTTDPSAGKEPTVAGRNESATATGEASAAPAAVPESSAAARSPDASAQVAMLTEAAPAVRLVDKNRSVTVRSGDTLMGLLVKAGVPRTQGHAVITALRKVFNPRSILPGQEITITTRNDVNGDGDGQGLLRKVSLRTAVDREVVVSLGDDGTFEADQIKFALRTTLIRATGSIESSLYVAGRHAGLPPSVLIDLMRIYSWDVDFERDMQRGDGFDVVFERLTTEDGEMVRDGAIVYAELRLGAATHTYYHFVDKHGRSGYFDENGQSARKPLLRTPVDGARLTSRYGRRRHPVLGYTRMHRGVDFAAPRGTPVYAAGDGRIVYRGRKGAFGRYIRIRHNSRYATAYAHLNAFRRGVTSGSRVKQGQVIGYVGSTGTATGPHLHFEVLVGGHQVNPLKVRLPSGRRLKGEQLAAFQAMRGALSRRLADLPTPGINITSN